METFVLQPKNTAERSLVSDMVQHAFKNIPSIVSVNSEKLYLDKGFDPWLLPQLAMAREAACQWLSQEEAKSQTGESSMDKRDLSISGESEKLCITSGHRGLGIGTTLV